MLHVTALFTYSLAALAFLAIGVRLVIRRTVYGPALSSACLMTSIWAGAVAFGIIGFGLPPLAIDLLDLSKSIAWIVLLYSMLDFDKSGKLSHLTAKPASWLIMIVAGAFLGVLYSHWEIDTASSIQAKSIGPLILALLGMLLVEQSFRNGTEAQRWSIKLIGIGVGAMFAYEFYLYSDAMLFVQINDELIAARGAVIVITAPLIAIAAFRRAKIRPRIVLSRHLLFHSVTLLGAAAYLLLMAAAGYYLRFFGGSWGSVMQATLLFAGAILLAMVIFSGTLRSWLKVFISKNFYTYRYDYREEWTRFTKSLSGTGHELGARTVQAVAELVHSTGGALWIARESGHCEPAAHWNLLHSLEVEPTQSSFCTYLLQRQWIIDLNEFNESPAKYPGLLVPEWLNQLKKAWLVIPLVWQGKLFGFIVLAESRSKININWEILDLLKVAAQQATSYLAHDESMKALLVARQFESFNRMSTFVVHDLKNLVAQLSLLVANAERHKDSEEFRQDMVETVAYSADKMRLLLQKFNRGGSLERPVQLSLNGVLEKVVASKMAYRPQPQLEKPEADIHVIADSERLERVISHMVQNALEATPKDGCVSVRLTMEGDYAVIQIQDNGQGMTEDFLAHRLFKPFESTKVAGMGIGLYEMREYILELRGQIEVISEPSSGTNFTLKIPRHKANINEIAEAA